ncbi:MAG: type II/IV secretion system ATPase subunit [Candidatus Micrarchaeia archaeon]
MEPEEVKLAKYMINANGLVINIEISKKGEFVPIYDVTYAGIGEATKILLGSMRPEILASVPVDQQRLQDENYIKELNKNYQNFIETVLEKYLPGLTDDIKNTLIAYIKNMFLGLGDLEVFLADENLEEVAVNTANEPVWVFHKDHGWCKSTIKLESETSIYEISEQIGRRVGREISNLTPIMDAELADGSRVNATLFPISVKGNTITIRKFATNPWSMPALVYNKALSSELAGLIWLSIQNEISILISGGTASGKTSFLNAMSMFMPPNRRIISVEDTRELSLPEFLQWIPMQTRQPNPEGKGEVKLYDLMINALRQRPDIMLIGEIRVKNDAETLFEAIHTGHAVYGTLHADNAQDTIIRMTNPPIDIPKIMLNSIGAVVSLFRHRRLGIRRMLEFGEITNSGDVNVLSRWDIRNDLFLKVGDITRLGQTISLYGGYSFQEINQDIAEKASIIDWMIRNKIFDITTSGFIVANYYKNPTKVLDVVKENLTYNKELFK